MLKYPLPNIRKDIVAVAMPCVATSLLAGMLLMFLNGLPFIGVTGGFTGIMVLLALTLAVITLAGSAAYHYILAYVHHPGMAEVAQQESLED